MWCVQTRARVYAGVRLAAKLAYPNENHAPLGRNWLRAFLSRHPLHRSRRNSRVEAIRLRAATKENVRSWFALLELPSVKAIKPANRWNADEGGLMEGRSENALTLGYSKDSPLHPKDFNSRAWTSFKNSSSSRIGHGQVADPSHHLQRAEYNSSGFLWPSKIKMVGNSRQQKRGGWRKESPLNG